MKESTTYQAILEEGRAQGLSQGLSEGRSKGRVEGEIRGMQAALLRQGQRRFGPPPESVRHFVESLTDRQRLEELLDRFVDATSWDNLLAP